MPALQKNQKERGITLHSLLVGDLEGTQILSAVGHSELPCRRCCSSVCSVWNSSDFEGYIPINCPLRRQEGEPGTRPTHVERRGMKTRGVVRRTGSSLSRG